MATYYGVTATGTKQWYDQQGRERHGMAWYIVSGPSSTREEAERWGRQKIGDIRTETGTDIWRETEHKNFRVVPQSRLKRDYRIDPAAAVEAAMEEGAER